jgi:hypothetical protein
MRTDLKVSNIARTVDCMYVLKVRVLEIYTPHVKYW